MKKVLIANRGEIACRIIRSCRGLGLSPVAVYSEADAEAQHAQLADEAYCIGPARVHESYLKIEAILGAAQEADVDFVHPGYGLLSESPHFAHAVTQAGRIWVGPAPGTIAEMADKQRAREIAVAAHVPILPGSRKFGLNDLSALESEAAAVGFPLLIKATGGGGGIGMQPCRGPGALGKTAESVMQLAERAFGDGSIFLERFIQRARHIEVQVFGLGDGRVFHLFDRECSIQRRFQKIVEEAPAPGLSSDVRRSMAQAACRLAASQNYKGAGTIEFIYADETDDFFFLEMNTRIQVEHPVTEMITGVDIVNLQLSLAGGEDLGSLVGSEPNLNGHAIECRLYAENPEKNFLPAPGTLTALHLPPQSDTVRIDTGFVAGDRITPFYDPMIAKVITRGPDRPAAIAAMREALEQIYIEGIQTNLLFLQRIMSHPVYTAGSMDTRFVERYKPDLIAS